MAPSQFLAPLLVSALVAAAALAACGGGGNTAAESDYTVQANTTMVAASPPITKAHFVAYINKVCRQSWVTIADNWRFHRNRQDPKMSRDARFADSVKKSLLPGIVVLIFDDMHMLGAPPGEEKNIERIIGPMQFASETGELGRWQAHSIAEITRHFDVYNTRARRYGLDDCLVNEAHLLPIES